MSQMYNQPENQRHSLLLQAMTIYSCESPSKVAVLTTEIVQFLYCIVDCTWITLDEFWRLEILLDPVTCIAMISWFFVWTFKSRFFVWAFELIYKWNLGRMEEKFVGTSKKTTACSGSNMTLQNTTNVLSLLLLCSLLSKLFKTVSTPTLSVSVPLV